MGFYIRKSVKAGPFRFNLSKSGVGVSAGVKGLRLGTGPRGNYVHMGRGGLYFRRSLNPAGAAPLPAAGRHPTTPTRSPSDTVGPMREIESRSALEMTDSSAEELISEIGAKLRKLKFLPISIGATGAAIVVLVMIGAPSWAYVAALVASVVASVAARYRDEIATSVVLLYDFDKPLEQAYSDLHTAFDGIDKAAVAWHIPSTGDVLDRKYHAGASQVVTRHRIRPRKGQPKPLKTNIDVPLLDAGKQVLALMPERLLVFESKAVGAVSYSDLTLEVSSSRFIEEERVPKDSEVVDHTWRYVNKKGGPDRRFKDNPRGLIALYETIRSQSNSGLNEQFQISKVGTGKLLREAIARVAELLTSSPEPRDLKAN